MMTGQSQPQADCLALFSGMMDSILAVQMIQAQGLSVYGLHFCSAFTHRSDRAQRAADRLGMKLDLVQLQQPYYDLVRHPRFGYGRAVNPCIDCRAAWLRQADCRRRELGAEFVISGEVLGQKSFGQRRRDLTRIARLAGLSGRLLRPLSAQHLEPTWPERHGLIDRRRLGRFAGSSRKGLIRLARQWGWGDAPCAGPGCLLTEPHFASKVRDLWQYAPAARPWDYQLLNIGRHFRLSRGCKLVLSRNAHEAARLREMIGCRDASSWLLIEPESFAGPSALLVGTVLPRGQQIALALVWKYSRRNPDLGTFRFSSPGGEPPHCQVVQRPEPTLAELPGLRRIAPD